MTTRVPSMVTLKGIEDRRLCAGCMERLRIE